MIRHFARCVLAFFVLATQVAAQSGGQGSPKPPAVETVNVTPARVLVVIARYQGDKRISSLPYTLSVNAAAARGGVGQVRVGAEIPIAASASAAGADGKPPAPVSYENIGTQIDCNVQPTDDGRYAVVLSISDKSVYAEGEAPKMGALGRTPPFRSFRSMNTVVLRDGQSTQFDAAADRITGEVVRVEVTLTILKEGAK